MYDPNYRIPYVTLCNSPVLDLDGPCEDVGDCHGPNVCSDSVCDCDPSTYVRRGDQCVAGMN